MKERRKNNSEQCYMNFYDFLKLVQKTVTKTKSIDKQKDKKNKKLLLPRPHSHFKCHMWRHGRRPQVFDLWPPCPSAVWIQGTLSENRPLLAPHRPLASWDDKKWSAIERQRQALTVRTNTHSDVFLFLQFLTRAHSHTHTQLRRHRPKELHCTRTQTNFAGQGHLYL